MDEVKHLIRRGVNVNWQSLRTGEHILSFAAMWKNNDYENHEKRAQIIRMLRKAGANVNMKNDEDECVLCKVAWHYTAIAPSSIIEALIENEEQNALKCSDTSLASARFVEANVKCLGAARNTAFGMVARVNNVDAVKVFLNAGVDIDQWNPMRLTPLMMAIKEGAMDVAAYLLKRGASINNVDVRGYTALEYLCNARPCLNVHWMMILETLKHRNIHAMDPGMLNVARNVFPWTDCSIQWSLSLPYQYVNVLYHWVMDEILRRGHIEKETGCYIPADARLLLLCAAGRRMEKKVQECVHVQRSAVHMDRMHLMNVLQSKHGTIMLLRCLRCIWWQQYQTSNVMPKVSYDPRNNSSGNEKRTGPIMLYGWIMRLREIAKLPIFQGAGGGGVEMMEMLMMSSSRDG